MIDDNTLKEIVKRAKIYSRCFVPLFLLCAAAFAVVEIVDKTAGTDALAYLLILSVIAGICASGFTALMVLLGLANGKIKRAERARIVAAFRENNAILEGAALHFYVELNSALLTFCREDGGCIEFDLSPIEGTVQFAYMGSDILKFLQAYYAVNLEKGKKYDAVDIVDRVGKTETLVHIIEEGKLSAPLKGNPFYKEGLPI